MKRMKFNALLLAISLFSMLVITSCDKDNDVSLTSITLDKTIAEVGLGETLTLTATFNPIDATNKALTWSSENASVASVVDGVVTGVALGTTTITATSVENPLIKSICVVEVVYPVELTGIALNKTSTKLENTKNETLTVTFTPADATNKEVTWTSSNEAVATVAAGVVTAVSAGETVITATSVANSLYVSTCTVQVISTTISGDITEDQTWYKEFKYKLSGFVYVKNNAKLTIEAGTIIQGLPKDGGVPGGTLIIERGSKIIAAGTANEPIVFTSSKAAGSRAAGDWGGLVLCGYAKTNKADAGAGVGVAEGGIGSQYGGLDDNDNSGVLQFVRIEFAGIALTTTANSEINGLTLYAVGKATTIDHIQVSYSGDDSYEWFGGSVNCKYLVALCGLDDDFDTDNGFTGTVQFGVGIRNTAIADQSKSNGFESDNDATGSVTQPFTLPIFSNITSYGPLATSASAPNSLYQSALHLRRGTRTSIYNSVFIGWPSGLRIDGGQGDSPAQATNDVLQIENTVLAGMTLAYANVTTNATGYTTAESQAYFESPNRNNVTDATLATFLPSLLSLTTPSFTPVTSLLTGAAYTNPRLSGNAFLDKTGTFRGAFGSTDWTAGWCNFDPQNTTY